MEEESYKKIPNSVCWNITRHCNDNCLFCYRDAVSEDLEWKERKRIIEKIADAGIRKLTFAGGEPLLLPEIQELILYAKEKGLVVSLTTNGILLEGELFDFCLKQLNWLSLSLDGVSEEIQQKMTRNSKHLQKIQNILEKISCIEKRNCRVKINTIVSAVNQDHIIEMADKLFHYAIDRWKLFQFVPLRGTAKKYNTRFLISDVEFNQVAEEIVQYLKKQERWLSEKRLLSISGRENIESAYFVIFPNGDVKMSTNLQDTVLGNALQDDLQKIWEHGNYQKILHKERTEGVLDRERNELI